VLTRRAGIPPVSPPLWCATTAIEGTDPLPEDPAGPLPTPIPFDDYYVSTDEVRRADKPVMPHLTDDDPVKGPSSPYAGSWRRIRIPITPLTTAALFIIGAAILIVGLSQLLGTKPSGALVVPNGDRPATGVVTVAFALRTGPTGITYPVKVQYTVSNKGFHSVVDDNTEPIPVGTHVTVSYDPANPGDAQAVSIRAPTTGTDHDVWVRVTGFGAALILVSLIYFVTLLRRNRRREEVES
jgi:hypothetical protein